MASAGISGISLRYMPVSPMMNSRLMFDATKYSAKSRTARSSASETGMSDGCEPHGLRARSRFMTMALSSEVDSALLEVPARVKWRPSAE